MREIFDYLELRKERLRRFVLICLTIVFVLIGVRIGGVVGIIVTIFIGIGSFFSAELGLWSVLPCGLIIFVANMGWGEPRDFLYLSIIGTAVGILLGLGIRKMIG